MAAYEASESDEKFAAKFGLELPLAAGKRPVEHFVCTLQVTGWTMPHAGTMYVGRTHVFFAVGNRLVGGHASFAYADVTSITPTTNLLMLPAIRIETYEETFFFASLLHRANAAAFLTHFYAATVAPRTFLHRKLVRGDDFQSGLLTGGTPLRGRLLGRAQDESVLVDRLRTSRALQLAYDALAIGTSTLTELDAQGQTIARQRRAIAHVQANLDVSDRLLRGMSLTGRAALAVTSGPASVSEADAAAAAEFTYSSLLQIPVVDRTTSSYAPARLVFDSSAFFLLAGDAEADDDGTKTLVRVAGYAGIEDLNVLAQPYHLRIDLSATTLESNKAKPSGTAVTTDSIVLVSAYIEDIILELAERTVADIPLTIEPGAPPLSHKTGFYASTPAFARRSRGGKEPAGEPVDTMANPAHMPLPSNAFMPTSDADAAKAERLRQQQALMDAEDAQLEEMSHVLESLKAVAATMGTTLDRQNAALDGLSAEVDAAQGHLTDTHRKVLRKL